MKRRLSTITIIVAIVCLALCSCDSGVDYNTGNVSFSVSGTEKTMSTGNGENAVLFSQLSHKINLTCLDGTGFCSLLGATTGYVDWPESSVQLGYGTWVVRAQGCKDNIKYYENSTGVQFIVGPQGVSLDSGSTWGSSVFITESYCFSGETRIRANTALTVKNESGSTITLGSGDYEAYQLKWFITETENPENLTTAVSVSDLTAAGTDFKEWLNPDTSVEAGSNTYVAAVIVKTENPSDIYGTAIVKLENLSIGLTYVLGSGESDFIQFGQYGVVFDEPVEAGPVDYVNKILNTLEKGGELVLDQIGADTEIALSDFTLEDGIYFEVVENPGATKGLRSAGSSKKGISKGANAFDSGKLFRRQDGSIIPIPGQDGNVSFTGEDLGLFEAGRIIIHRLMNLDDDFEILATEPQHQWHSTEAILEEYYYVSFLDPRFVSLNPSEIVFVTSGAGHQGVSILQEGMLNRNLDGVYDFSGKWFTGFAVNMFKSMIVGSEDSIQLFIKNPIHVGTDSKALNSHVNVIMVDERASKDYKVVVRFSGNNASDVMRKIANSYQALQYLPRYTDGSVRAADFYPEFDLENNTITYHIGSVDRSFLFNLYFDEDTGFQPGTATVVLEEDDSDFEPFDFSNFSNEVVIKAPSNGIVTWSYKAGTEIDAQVKKTIEEHIHVFTMNVSENGRGTGGFGGNSEHVSFSGFGFLIFEYNGDETNVPVLTISKLEKKGLDCSAIGWDYETEDYVCIDDNCEHCSIQGYKQHYSRFFIEWNRDEIFHNALFRTANEYNGYGRIGWTVPFLVQCSENIKIVSETFGGDSRFPAPPRVIAANKDNRTEMVKLYLNQIVLSENKIVVNIAFGDPEVWYYNVEMYSDDIIPEQETSEYILFGGSFPAQRSFSPINPSGKTAKYVSGTTETDVTDSVIWKNADSDSPTTWGNALIKVPDTTDQWKIADAKFRAEYEGLSYTINAGPLRGQYASNTHETAISVPNTSGSFVTFDISDKYSNLKGPINDKLDGGYLIEGIGEDKNVWAVFSYDYYCNDTPSDINILLTDAGLLGAQIGDSAAAPSFGDWRRNDIALFCVTVTGEGTTGAEYVVVVGELANAIDPDVGIKRSDFKADCETFFFKTVNLQ